MERVEVREVCIQILLQQSETYGPGDVEPSQFPMCLQLITVECYNHSVTGHIEAPGTVPGMQVPGNKTETVINTGFC